AARHPEKILRAVIDPVVGVAGYQARDLAFGLGLKGNAVNSFVKFALGTYRAYGATDSSIVEINPLVVTKQGEVIALDAKINLDVGGGADEEKVTAAFKLLLSDPRVKAVLVNIFGGIMKCDVIAAGIIAAAKQVHLEVPLVVRLEGTNVEQGKALLASSGLAITPADDLGDAARKAVAAANGAGGGVRRVHLPPHSR